MVYSGHPRWGFLVYRTSYTDDAAWQRYLHILHRSTWISLNNEHQTRLYPYASFTPMEDRVFEGASKDTIREQFQSWVLNRSVERDGPGANLIQLVPRYRICMYADKEILDNTSIEDITTFSTPFAAIEGRAVLIDTEFGQHYTYAGRGDEQHEPVDGKTTWGVDWMYVYLEFTSIAYNRLCGGSEEWNRIEPSIIGRRAVRGVVCSLW